MLREKWISLKNFGFALALICLTGAALSIRLSSADGSGYIDTHVHLGGLAERAARRSDGSATPGSPGSGADPWRGPRTRSSPSGLEMQNPPGRPGSGGSRRGIYEAAADNLVTMMDGKGIATAMVVTVPGKGPGGERNDSDRAFIADAVKRHPGRLRLMDGGATLKPLIEQTPASGVTDAVRHDFIARAEAVLDAGAVGFGEMIVLHFCLGPTHSYQATPADHPLFLALADVAARRNVPMDVHMEAVSGEVPTPDSLRRACSQNPVRLPASVPAFERLLSHNRGTRIVWQHIGWDNYGAMTTELMRGLLARHPNLFLSLRVERRTTRVGARSEPMPNRIVDDKGLVKSEWLRLFREFPDRFMIGSDEFVGSRGGLTTEPIASFDETWAMLKSLPADIAGRIGRENAARVYHLE